MSQLLLLVKYKTKHNAGKDFIDKVNSSGILKRIYAEDGFISYNYYFDAADQDGILLVEEWESEVHQQKHLQAAHMNELKKIKEKYVLDT